MMTLEKVAHNAHASVHPNVAAHLRGYPLERLWYLLFDYNRRNLGPAGFDKPHPSLGKGRDEHEKGYMSSMFSGLDYVLATIDEPLSLDYLQGLHDAAVSKVVHKITAYASDDKSKTMVEQKKHEKGYRQGDNLMRVGLTAAGPRRNVTLAGLTELRDRVRRKDNYFRIIFSDDHIDMNILFYSDKNIPLELDKADISDEELYARICERQDVYTIRFAHSQTEILVRLETIISEFNTHMTQGISEDEKIRAIAQCVQDILLTHPFSDGNGRTTSLLLNKLLLQHNLSPTIIENPTMIDAFSVAELCEEIKKGQDVFRAQKKRPLFGDPMVPETEDSVMYLEGNRRVAALLVHSATEPIFIWDEINISDRKLAVDLLINDLCANSPTLTAKEIKNKEEKINEKVTISIYRKGIFQFFSSGPMISEVMRSASHGKLGEATHMLLGGNQYGIDFKKLDNSNQQQDTPSHRP